MILKLRALCVAVLFALGLVAHATKANAQAAQLPPSESCFQATTGLTGIMGSVGTITAGSGGTAGTYGGVALLGGTGSGASANITVGSTGSGIGVTAVAILDPGAQYTVGDTITATVGNVTGFSFVLASTSINSSLAGGTVGMYIPGTLTYSQTYQNANQTILNTNPIQLDLNGCALIYGTGTYRQILYDSLGNEIWDQPTTAPTSATAAAFSQPDIGSVPRTFLAHDQDFVDLLDFLPVGEPNNLNHNNSAGAQVAANAGCARAASGMKIYTPPPPNFGSTSASAYYFNDIVNQCANNWEGGGRGGVGGNETARGGEIITGGGTLINYSAANNFLMEWAPPNWPAVTSNQLILGGGISNMSFQTSAADVTSTALKVWGTWGFKGENLGFFAANSGVELYGDQNPTFSDVFMIHTYGLNWWLHGDLKGQTQSGAACPNGGGDCSSRLDSAVLRNLENIDNTNHNTVFTVQDFVSDMIIDHSSGEGSNIGMNVFCDAPTSVTPNFDLNGGNCPTHLFLYDNQFELCHTVCLQASDFLQMRIHTGYFYGENDMNGIAANDATFASINYTSSFNPPGRLTIDGGTLFFVANHDCVLFTGTLWDIDINHVEANACNVSNTTFGVINLNGAFTHVRITDSTLGLVDEFNGGFPVYGINVGAGVVWGNFHDNLFDGLTLNGPPIVAGPGDSGTVNYHDNQGPGSNGPAFTSCGSGATGGSFTFSKDNKMIVSFGVGATLTSCSLKTSNPQPQAPICNISPAPGANASGLSLSTTQNVGPPPTSVITFGVGSGDLHSSSYLITCPQQ